MPETLFQYFNTAFAKAVVHGSAFSQQQSSSSVSTRMQSAAVLHRNAVTAITWKQSLRTQRKCEDADWAANWLKKCAVNSEMVVSPAEK